MNDKKFVNVRGDEGMSQKKLIEEEDWGVLIILDACRHDYFEKVYTDYLDGELRKVESTGTHTGEWLKKTFDGVWDDVVYVSGNPWINSQNVETRGFKPKETFPNIVDAWDGEWKEGWTMLSPDTVGKTARMVRARQPGKRMIVHFIQPHAPYRKCSPKDLDIFSTDGGNGTGRGWKVRLKEFIFGTLVGLTSYPSARTVRSVLRELGLLGEEKGINELAKKYGYHGLREFYLDNLNWVLEEVKKLVERLPDEKMVVTSDHGEFLGEEGEYGHNRHYEHPVLLEVPWLRVEG